MIAPSAPAAAASDAGVAHHADVARHHGAHLGRSGPGRAAAPARRRRRDRSSRLDPVGQLPRQVAPDTGAGDHALGQAVRRQPVRAVHARARHLADGVQAAAARYAVEAGRDATARVVRGRRHRDPVAGRVDADLPAGGGDRREPLVEPLAHVRRVEEHVVVDPARRLGHAPADRRGDDVARREILQRMHALHHPLAGGVVQDRALAAHGFADERLLARRHRARATSPSGGTARTRRRGRGSPARSAMRHAVAGDRRRVRRRREHLAVAARRDHDRAGGDDADRHDAARRRRASAIAHPGRLRSPVGSACRSRGRGRTPGSSTSTPAPIADSSSVRCTSAPLLVATGVDDAVVAVAALAGQRGPSLPSARRVERGAEAHQVADRLRRLGDQFAHDRLVAQPGTGGERVADVVLERVARVEHTGQPALGPRRASRPTRMSLVTTSTLRTGRAASAADEPGRTRPEHDHVDVAVPCRGGAASCSGQHAHRRGRRRGAALTRPSATGCRWRSSARPTGGRARRCRRRRRPRRCRRAASAAAWPGVIIFMYLHTAARLTGSNSRRAGWPSAAGAACRSRWRRAPSWRSCRGRRDHPARRQDLRAGLGHDAGDDEVQRARGAAALGVDEQLGVGSSATRALSSAPLMPAWTWHSPIQMCMFSRPGDPLHVGAEELIGAEQHVAVGGDRRDDLDGVRRRAADVGLGLHRGRRVDVADDDGAGMLGLPRPELVGGDRLGEAAPGPLVGDQHRLVVAEDLGRLGHEVHAAEHDRRRVDLGGDPRQPERVAGVVGDVLDLGELVVVGEDHGVAARRPARGPARASWPGGRRSVSRSRSPVSA